MKEEKENMNNLAFEEKSYTYEDLLKFDDDKRYELIDGKLYLMGASRTSHQLILGELYEQFKIYLKGKKCRTILSPIDVRLDAPQKGNKAKYVVEPDLVVVCNKEKIDERGIVGVPDLVVEILSPSTKQHDKLIKFNLYQHYKIREYWIIDIEEQIICPYILNNEGIYTLPKMYEITEDIKVNVLDNLTISLKEFWKENEGLLK